MAIHLKRCGCPMFCPGLAIVTFVIGMPIWEVASGGTADLCRGQVRWSWSVTGWQVNVLGGFVCWQTEGLVYIYRWILVVDKLAWASCSRVRHDMPAPGNLSSEGGWVCCCRNRGFELLFVCKNVKFWVQSLYCWWPVLFFIQQRHLQGWKSCFTLEASSSPSHQVARIILILSSWRQKRIPWIFRLLGSLLMLPLSQEWWGTLAPWCL